MNATGKDLVWLADSDADLAPFRFEKAQRVKHINTVDEGTINNGICLVNGTIEESGPYAIFYKVDINDIFWFWANEADLVKA